MDYTLFVTKAITQDERNKFESYDSRFDIIPDEIKLFYLKCNPIDVELNHNGVGVRLHPVSYLHELQKEYSYINAQFVFATCNGDPIFINNGCIYTCAHGTTEPQHEKIAESFIEYLKSLVDLMS